MGTERLERSILGWYQGKLDSSDEQEDGYDACGRHGAGEREVTVERGVSLLANEAAMSSADRQFLDEQLALLRTRM